MARCKSSIPPCVYCNSKIYYLLIAATRNFRMSTHVSEWVSEWVGVCVCVCVGVCGCGCVCVGG